MYDVVIVGAGPAGLTLARLVGRSARVLLVDRRDTRCLTEAPKCCGGLLSPAAQRELARQGLGVPGEVVSGPQLFAVHTRDLVTGDERLYQRHYLNVDRGAFDSWLESLVPADVDRAFGWRFTGLEREDGSSMVRFATPGGGTASVRAALVVAADGAASAVRRAAWPSGAQAPCYTAVQGTFLAAHDEPHFGAVFDARLTDHYGWTVPKGEMLLVGLAVPSAARALRAYETFVERLREQGVALGFETARSAAPTLRPGLPSHLRLCGEGVLLLGEAAGLVSPSSAEGISYALRSAAMAAYALASGGAAGAAERYAHRVRPLAMEVLAKVAKARAISSPPVRQAVMRSGLGAIRPEAERGYGAAMGELLAP